MARIFSLSSTSEQSIFVGLLAVGTLLSALGARAEEVDRAYQPPRATTVAMTPTPRAEYSAAREEFLRSAPWQDLMVKFDDWLATQALYDELQVRQIQARLHVGITRMSGAQLQDFADALGKKLAILSGEKAEAAEDALAKTMAVASPAYARRVRQQLPDVLTSSPAQLEQKLAGLGKRQKSTTELQKAFARSRQDIASHLEAQRQAQRAARLRAEQREAAAIAEASAAVVAPPMRSKDDFYMTGGNFNTGYDGQAGLTWGLAPPGF